MCTDFFTNWSEAAAIKDLSADCAAKFLFDVICRHGSPAIIQSDQGREPAIIQSDQGREFVNSIKENLFQLTDVEHKMSAAYYPGLDERFNQTIVNTLTKMVDGKKEEWDKFINAALFAYRYKI